MKPAIVLSVIVLLSGAGSVVGGTVEQVVSGAPAITGNELRLAARPAAKGESPEEVELKKLPPPAKKENIHRPSKAELVGKCRKDPECAKQLGAAQGGGKGVKPRPAATGESPEEIELKKLPPPAKASPPPRSEAPSTLDTFLSWLNPVGTAQAAGETLSVHLTPDAPYSSTPYSFIYAVGTFQYFQYARPENFFRLPTYVTLTGGNADRAEGNPYVLFFVNVPETGWYLINFSASRGTAKLRHQYNGPIIKTWDFSSDTCNPCDYLTSEYLAAGSHAFYFWSDQYRYVYSASADSYP